MKHSIITVTYNSSDTLSSHWNSFEHLDGIEWIVVDNNSQDSSVSIAEKLGARVIPLPRNVGFGAANNIGFAASTGEYVWFINPDVKVEPKDLERLSDAADVQQGLVGPQLLNTDGSMQPNGRSEPFLSYKIMNRLAPNQISGRYHVFASPGSTVKCSWLTGAAVGSSREILKKVQVWDDHFFVYYEDTDLGLRAHGHDVASFVVGDVNWTHTWARETKSFRWAPWKLEVASMVKFYWRYPRFILPRF